MGNLKNTNEKTKENSIEMKETTKEFLRTSEDNSVTNTRLAQEIVLEARNGEDFISKIDKEVVGSFILMYPEEFARELFDLSELEDTTNIDLADFFGISKEAQENFQRDFIPNIERLYKK
jgi:protein-tyrosine-phosphatase